MNTLSAFLNSSINNLSKMWSYDDISQGAINSAPDMLFSGCGAVLKHDMNLQWLSWFCEALCFIDNSNDEKNLHDIFSLVRRGLINLGHEYNCEIQNTAVQLALFLYRRQLSVNGRNRQRATRQFKIELLESAGKSPRCWICNSKFTDESIELFKGGGRPEIKLPEYIDFIFPRGLCERDLKIEIEHKHPFSKGGQDLYDDLSNVALSCGWCNRHKWNFLSLYEPGVASCSFYNHDKLGPMSIPEPFWIIRKMALSNGCEAPGCTVKRKNNLFIKLINPHGMANPLNLMVVCKSHLDNNYQNRLVPSSEYKSRLGKRTAYII
ncbi:HNH endonuclease [Aeromonas veronii]|uniref:HNH endonuclease n=1 Tax=Aeromonas veronii TaxID=654 RepID=A0A653KVC9_AERVE|nr:HNH endonuclease [Aeromonas veronii]VXA83214.1 HNH endonuclease [Aeromonas veronii]